MRSGWIVVLALLSVPELGSSRAADIEVYRSGGELVVRLDRLDLLRQTNRRLDGIVELSGDGGKSTINVDWADPVVPAGIVIDAANYGEIESVTVGVRNERGDIVRRALVAPVPAVEVQPSVPLLPDTFATIEPGTEMRRAGDDEQAWRNLGAPQIAMPDVAKLRRIRLTTPSRVVTGREIEFPVVAEADLPVPASENYVVVGRQSFAPSDNSQRSLYFSYRKAIYDDSSGHKVRWRKFLVEVPLKPAWATGAGDATLNLSLGDFAVHATDELAPRGANMLGDSPGGLAQGGQSTDTDDEGRIYFTNVSDGAGLVRFDPRTGRFEQPPVYFDVECRKLIPPETGWSRSFDTSLGEVVCLQDRVFILYARNYRVHTPNGNFETCSGVVSVPQDNWHDAEAFRAGIRLHAGCWPDAKFPLYGAAPPANDYSRKLLAPVETDRGLAFGTWRLDLDAQGETQRLIAVKSIAELSAVDGSEAPPARQATVAGLSKQRDINVGAAGRAFVRNTFGELTMTRAAVALALPRATADQVVDGSGRFRSTYPGAPVGTLTIRFDLAAKIKSESSRLGELAAALDGLSPGPNYCITPIPGKAGQALGVCEYGYFLSQFDFSRRNSERVVSKRYLPLLSRGEKTALPVQCGLGPYNAAWVEDDRARWLYLMGYTGIARVEYSVGGTARDAFVAEAVHSQIKSQPVDGVARDHVKDYLQLFPAVEGRWINIGRGRPARGGGAFSTGLELFDPRNLGVGSTAVYLSRGFNLYTPAGRLVFGASADSLVQQIFCASGAIKPEYAQDLADTRQLPRSDDAKVFAYECRTGAELRDRYGFALPKTTDRPAEPCHLALSRCRRFLVLLQSGGTVYTYEIATGRWIDGVRLSNASGESLRPMEFSRPSAFLWTSPDDRMFFHADTSQGSTPSVGFFEIRVSVNGVIEVSPHLHVAGIAHAVQEFGGVVRCFMPDLANADGSYDFVLGGDAVAGRPMIRVIDDFVPPKN